MARPSDQVVSSIGLTKEFAPGVGAVDVDLDVRRGEIYGFLGPNGAGKSTTLEMLTGVTQPDRGIARVLGMNPWRSRGGLMKRVGVLPSAVGFARHHTGRSQIALIGRIRSLPSFVPKAEELAERFELDLSRRASDLSLGNRQKLGLVLAAAHEPELLILDEPTSGLDPLMQLRIDDYLRELAHGGASVLLSSHSLPQVERTADRVGFIRDARLVAQGPLSMLRSREHQRATLTFPGPAVPGWFVGLNEDTGADDSQRSVVTDVQVINAHTLEVTWTGSAASVLACAGRHGVSTIDTHHELELSFLELYDSGLHAAAGHRSTAASS